MRHPRSTELNVRPFPRRAAAAFFVAALLASALPPLPAFAAQATADSLTGYWKFDETSAGSFTDASGDDGAGTGVGVTGANNTPQPSTDVPSAVSFPDARSLDFDGTDDGVDFGSFAPRARTISFWLKMREDSDAPIIYAGADAWDSSQWDWAVYQFPGMQLSFNTGFGASGVGDTGFSLNTWYHYALVRSEGGEFRVYKDGDLLGTAADSSVTDGIVRMGKAGSVYFDGLLDDVRIYDRNLAPWEIRELAAGRHVPAYWKGRSGRGFERKQNWSGSYVPDPYSRIVTRAATGSLTLTGAIQSAALTIGSGSALFLNDQEMMINDDGVFTNYGTLAAKNNADALYNVNIPTDKGTVMLMGTGSRVGMVTGSSYHHLILNDGLVGYWTFDETSGIRAADVSGYGHSGTLVGGPSITSGVAPVRFADARALSFDGTDDYVNVPYTPVLQPPVVTYAAWAKAAGGNSNNPRILSNDNPGTGNRGFYIGRMSNDGSIYYGVGTGGFKDSTTIMALNTWYHVAVTYNGSVASLFVNGTRVDTVAAGSLPYYATGSALRIGRSETLSDAGTNWNGSIDDVRVYNRALTAGEVAALAAGNQPSLQKGSVTLSETTAVFGDLVLNGGTLDAASESLTVYGDWLNNGGVFNPRRGTVTFGGGDAGLTVLSGGQRFNDVTFNRAGTTWTLADRFTASGVLTLAAGTLDADATGSYPLRAGRFVQAGGTFQPRSGIVSLTSPAGGTSTFTATLNQLQIEDPTEYGLAGYWKFDEGTNTGSIVDSSPYGNAGVRRGTGGVIWSGSTLASAIGFHNAFAMKFDTVNDYVEIADSSAHTNNAFSACTWLKWDGVRYSTASLRDWAGLISKGRYNSGEFTMLMSRNSAASTNTFGFYINGGSRASFTTSSTIGTTWHHVCAVYDQATAKLYFDGVEKASSAYTSAVTNTTNPLHIGDENGGAYGYRFGGYLDDVRYYARALSASEARSLADGAYADGDKGTATVTLGGNLDLATLTIASGLLSAGARVIDVSGDWNNYAGTGAFVMGTSTVDLDGSTTQTVRGSTNFADFEISTSAAQTVRFSSGSVIGVAGSLILQGAASNLLTLAPVAAGYEWFINLADDAAQAIDYVSPSYSDASPGHFIAADDGTSTDGGNNANWLFVTPEVSFQSGAITLPETAGTVTLRIARSGSTIPTLSIPFTVGGTATGAGSDYTVVSGSPLSMIAGLTSTGLVLTLVDDAAAEADETIVLTLGTPTNAVVGATGSLTITVTSDEVATSPPPPPPPAGGSGGAGGGGGGGQRGSDFNMARRIADARDGLVARYRHGIGGAAASSARAGTRVAVPFPQPDDEGSPSSLSAPDRRSRIAENRGLLVVVLGEQEVLYRDVHTDAWYAPYVAAVIEDGIAEGYKDEQGRPKGEFGVANPVTVAEMLKMALEASGQAEELPALAPDNRSARATWAAPYVRLGEDLELAVLASNPDVHRAATRGEVIQTVLEVMKVPTAIQLPPPFTDVPAGHPYAKAVTVAAAYGLVTGDTSPDGAQLGTFRPDDGINRAEVAKIIALLEELL